MHDWPTHRIRSFPTRSDEIWQGKLVRLPAWVTEEGSEPYRPLVPMWLAVTDDRLGPVDAVEPEQDNTTRMIDAFFRFAMESEFGGYRPGTVEVCDAALAERLQDLLADCDVAVRLVDNMTELERAEESLRAHYRSNVTRVPSLLDASGVTIDRVRRFAEAAADFYRAKLWLLLSDVDLIHVRAPYLPRQMQVASILGAGRQTYGIGFFAEAEDSYRLHQGTFDFTRNLVWSFTYDAITETIADDCDLWLDHNFPVAGPLAYPTIVRYPLAKVARPSAKELAFVEGLLRALACTTEEQIDGGCWTTTVETADGEAKYGLSIHDLLKPPTRQTWMERGFTPDRRVFEQSFTAMERFFEQHPAESVEEMNQMMEQHFIGKTPDEFAKEPTTPEEVAQDLCHQALETYGRRRVQLARKALDSHADCAEAQVILAEQAGTLEWQLQHYTSAIEAAKRTIGPSAFDEQVGHFWGVTSTRAYMRARFGLAQTLEEMGQIDDAIGHFQELLRLNPNDNQGVRYLLLPRLLQTNRDVEAARLLKAYDDTSANWAYSQAVLAFRLSGPSAASRSELRMAFRANQHVPEVLPEFLERTGPPHIADHYSLGSPEEAAICIEELLPVLTATPECIDWILDEHRRWTNERRKKQRNQLLDSPRTKGKKRRPGSRRKRRE